MKKYALIAGGLFGSGIFLHFLNAVDFESLLHAIPIFVTWFTITITFVVYILDDYHRHDSFQSYPKRLTTNDAYPLLKVSLAYQLLFHLLLLVTYPVFEAVLAFAAFAIFLNRYQKA